MLDHERELQRWTLRSLYRVGVAGDLFAREPIERALAILLMLHEEGRLAPEHESMISSLREVLGEEGPE